MLPKILQPNHFTFQNLDFIVMDIWTLKGLREPALLVLMNYKKTSAKTFLPGVFFGWFQPKNG